MHAFPFTITNIKWQANPAGFIDEDSFLKVVEPGTLPRPLNPAFELLSTLPTMNRFSSTPSPQFCSSARDSQKLPKSYPRHWHRWSAQWNQLWCRYCTDKHKPHTAKIHPCAVRINLSFCPLLTANIIWTRTFLSFTYDTMLAFTNRLRAVAHTFIHRIGWWQTRRKQIPDLHEG